MYVVVVTRCMTTGMMHITANVLKRRNRQHSSAMIVR